MTSIGSVAVDVVPDARGFPEKLRAQLSSLGDVQVKVRPDDASVAETKARLEAALRNVNAKVDLDTSKAQVQAAALRKSIDDVGKSDGFAKQQRSLGLLGTALATLGPGVIPIAGAATAAAGAFGLLGAAGVLAVLGIKNEMKAGSPIGQQYSADITALKTSLGQLEHSAASGFLGPFNAAVAQSQVQMKQLNPQVHDFAAIAGNIAGHGLSGLIGGFHTLNPLLSELAVDADKGAAAFDRYANGGGLEKFQTFVQANLPSVIDTIQQVASAVGRIVAAVGPLGGVSLTVLRTLAEVINALPVPVITALAVAFITLKTASTGLSVLGGVANGLESISKVGRGLGASGTGLATGLLAGGAAAGVATLAITGLSLALQQNAKYHQENVQYVNSFTQALQQSSGAVDGNVRAQAAQILTQNGWIKSATAVGVSADVVTDAALGNKDALNQVNDAFKRAGQGMSPIPTLIANLGAKFKYAQQQYSDFTDAATENNKALAQQNPLLAFQAASLGLTVSNLQAAQKSVTDKKAADAAAAAVQKVMIEQNYQLAGTQDQLSTKFGITTSQVQSYAAIMGITQEKVQAGSVSAAAYASAVTTITNAENNATASGSEFLGALQQFSTSAGTAADRAALIGATLKAANGDNLGFAASMNGAAVASAGLVTSLQQAASQAGKSGGSVGGLIASIVNLKNGTIDYSNAAAAPLIQGLQAMQTAAMAAASAQYQHEASIKGGKAAADDAYNTYVGQTRGALVDEASKLGLTKDQATHLANAYFGMPKDVKTRIEQEGAGPIVNILNSIKGILTAIARGWGIDINAQDHASQIIQNIRNQLNSLPGSVGVSVNATGNVAVGKTGDRKTTGGSYASGGSVADGWFTVGEGNDNTWELGHKSGSDVQMYSNPQAKQMMPGGPFTKVPGYAGGTVNGIQYTTSVAYQNAQARVANSLVSKDKALVVRFDRSDLSRFETALKGGAAGIVAAGRQFNADLKAAGASVPGLGGLESRLTGLANQRTNVTNRLNTAKTNLSGLQQQSAQEQGNVAGSVLSGFNITNGGNGSIAGLLANLTQNRDAATKFAGNLGTLKSVGLDPKLLAQLGEAGASGGGVNASLLAGASKAQIAQINALYKQTGAAATSAGATVAGAQFGPAISAWTKQVNSLTKQQSSLTRQIDHLGDVISARVGHALDVSLNKAVDKQARLALQAARARH